MTTPTPDSPAAGGALPPVLLSGRFHDHEVFLLAWSVLLGATFALGAPTPASLSAVVPRWAFVGWAAALGLSGVAGLLGCYWRGRLDVALDIERGALLMQCGVWLLFAGCVFAYTGLAGLTGGGITAAWGAANLLRAWRITKALRVHDRESAGG